MGIFVLVVFWVAVVFAISVLSVRTALCFAGLWILGLVIVTVFHIEPVFFLAYEAVLTVILCIMLKYEWS